MIKNQKKSEKSNSNGKVKSAIYFGRLSEINKKLKQAMMFFLQ